MESASLCRCGEASDLVTDGCDIVLEWEGDCRCDQTKMSAEIAERQRTQSIGSRGVTGETPVPLPMEPDQ